MIIKDKMKIRITKNNKLYLANNINSLINIGDIIQLDYNEEIIKNINNSNIIVNFKCDFCNNVGEKSLVSLNKMKNGHTCSRSCSSTKAMIKTKNVMLEKYGVDNIAKSDIVKQHIRESLYKNGTAPSSKQQIYINELLGGKLNYPVDYFSLDIAFPEIGIYIEYDGSGHRMRIKRGNITEKQFNKEEVNRKLYLQKQNWKLIRTISKRDKLYSDEHLLKLIDEAKQYLLNTNHTWVEIDIDANEYRCSQYVEKIK